MSQEEKDTRSVSRRTVIAGAAIVPVAAITSAAQPVAPVFSASQRRIVEAFIDRLIPKDELGPGAAECGVANYIERALGDFLAAEKAAFLEGIEATDALARRAHDHPFAELPPDKQDEVLTAMDNNTASGFANARVFFARIRRLTLEGMFGDPYYGGNKNFAGWDLIRYPGPRLAVSAADQKMGVQIKPYRSSAYGNHGH